MNSQNLRIVPLFFMRLSVGLTWAIVSQAAPPPDNTICVTTADELQRALTKTSDSGAFAGKTNVIQMASGHYKVGSATNNGPFKFRSTASTGGLTINGGYNAACTARSLDASLTILDGLGQSQVFQVVAAANPFEIHFLTIQGGSTTENGAGLSVNLTGSPSDGSVVDLEDLIFRNNKSHIKGGGFYVIASESITFASNLVVNNSAQGDFGAGVLTASGGTVLNNTVSANTTSLSNGTGGINMDFNNCILFNNILWANTNYGADFTNTVGAELFENDYGSLKTTPPNNQRHQSVDPSFVDPTHGDFHLAGDSPVMAHSYSPLYFVVDLEGHEMPSVGPIDLGAYQTTIFASGFEVIPVSDAM